MRSIATHPAGPHGQLAQKLVIGLPLLGDTICTGFARPLSQLHHMLVVSFEDFMCFIMLSWMIDSSSLHGMLVRLTGLQIPGYFFPF